MPKSFQVKLLSNIGKNSKLEALLTEYKRLVNAKIEEFWPLTEFKGAYPPKHLGTTGSKLGNNSAKKAWTLVKAAKQLGMEKPVFKAEDVDLDAIQCKVSFNHKTTFNGWIDVATLTKYRRIGLPFNSYSRLNKALKAGKLSKGIKLIHRKKGWFVQFVVALPTKSISSTKRVGIDVGINVSAFTSTNRRYGEDLKELRTRTKWRRYGNSNKMPYRQGLNRVAKQIVLDHPNTDFNVERLNFKGKKRSSTLHRSRLQNFACQHLAQKLEDLGHSEGFKVNYVNPAYTSQTCPECGKVDKRNRCGSEFRCVVCGYSAHADLVGALNINGGKAEVWLDGMARTFPVQKQRQEYPGTMGALALKDGGLKINSNECHHLK